jgi:universal stress protein E
MQPPEHPFHNILVVTDFSDHAAAAMGRAVSLAENADVKITALHVITDVAAAVPGTSFAGHWRIPPGELHHAEEKLRHHAAERLGEWLAPLVKPGREVASEVRVGVADVEIIHSVLHNKHDLVLAGTRGLSAVGRFLVGSTAERLIRNCPCPVWIVQPKHEWPVHSVLVPVDLTDVAAKALRLGCSLANRWGCPATALYVFNFPKDEAVALPTGTAGLEPPPARRAVRKQAARMLDEFVKQHGLPGTAVQQQLAVGYPWKVIGQAAKKLDAGLIVMGSVGRRGIPGFVIGNTAEKVLRQHDRSILTVKPDDFVSPVTG